MKKFAILFLISVLLIFSVAGPASAQTYYFSLDSEIVHVYWEEDGSLSLFYEFNFTNSTSADPIEFVDVGIPTSNYSLGNIKANVNGQTISHIADSEVLDGAVELGLGTNAISPGRSGQVTMQISAIRDVLYYDDDDDTYASAVFSPTWFGSDLVYGATDITVVFHLPPGVQPDEPRWHSAPSGFPSQPTTTLDSTGRVTYTWRNASANAYSVYTFGASFPKSYVPEGSISSPPLINIDWDAVVGFGMMCFFVLMFFGLPIMAVVGSQRRKLKYLPPKVAIEGHGIKRGLTAIEAAILLEEPMDKILTMILFAVIKKNATKVIKKRPPYIRDC